ncbi:zinc finger protein CONSTANS-LIKE 13-like [Asparagus officinalis]|uniref:zinc finger protein CONSTANS-LIKE 13-like n=1 Tax=Asparagus officinalis TaxID=4686 RepID=UPI00098E3736|nr:zinc finger protein CONSTANS-LIKE 13-like [Asparagus officinalis]
MGKEEEEEEEEEKPTNVCDFCSNSKAILYCRADDARLCLSCDRHVHQANSVCSRHPRALLCNSCSSAPSSIFCSSDGLVLCSNCDFEAHSRDGLSAHHGRRPVEAFSGCPSAVELVSVLGFGGNQEIIKKKKENEEEDDYLLGEEGGFKWEMPEVVRLDDLIVPVSDSCCGFQAIGVPPLPKDRNLACGKNKEEILHQLRELINSESPLGNDHEELYPESEFKSLLQLNNVEQQQDNLHIDVNEVATFTETPNFEACQLQWNNNDWQEATDPVLYPYSEQSEKFPDVTTSIPDGAVNFHQIHGENLSPLTPKRALELLCPDRDSVISRYKEKRKMRRYDKLIRYESRKARADSRVRIKGRFAKANQEPKL